jgi:cytosine/adenosine deaminase-related metal-dependent hydrolase
VYSYSGNVMFGTDGMHSDILRSAQAAYFSGISLEGLSVSGAWTRLRNAHRHTALHGACGDAPNNLIILDYDSPTPVTEANVLGHFFYGMDSSHVHSVVSRGRLIVKNKRLTTCGESEILAFANEQAERLWAKLR